jgi:hypothetical protein
MNEDTLKIIKPMDGFRILHSNNVQGPRFKIGQQVLYKETGQLVTIDGVNFLDDYGGKNLFEYSIKEDDQFLYWEDELIEYGVC